MDDHYGCHTDHPLLKVLNLRDNRLTFKPVGKETILERWLRLKENLQTCKPNGVRGMKLLDYFRQGLNLKIKELLSTFAKREC